MHTRSSFIFLIIISICGAFHPIEKLFASTAKSYLPDAEIYHDFTHDSFYDNNKLEAYLSDTRGLIAARCYFRLQSQEEYYFLKMTKNSEYLYTCSLPSFHSTNENVDYFFVVVNTRRQVIRSIDYRLSLQNPSQPLGTISSAEAPHEPIYSESSLLQEESSEVFASEEIVIESVPPSEDFAHRIGIPSKTDCPDLVKGYFGGFLLGESGKVTAIPGHFCPIEIQQDTLLPPQRSLDQSPAEKADDYVYLHGEDWEGSHYRSDDTEPFPIEANIIQDQRYVTIDTTEAVEYPAHHFVGRIKSNGGDIEVKDTDGQTWTTYYGPATDDAVILADFVWKPSGGPTPPVYIVDLARIVVEPEPVIDMPGIRFLLLETQ